MREDFWEFSPTHKLVLCSNHKPEVRGTDHAIWRRLALIPWNKQFWNPEKGETGPEDLRQDKALPEKLRKELPGILAWCVRGCLDWQRDGLRIPAEVRASTDEYRSEQDIVEAFLKERCLIGMSHYAIRASDIYGAYSRRCEKANERPMKQRKFGQQLTLKGFERNKNDGTWYLGVTLKNESEFDDQ